MADLDGLTHTEYLVLEPLDDESPTPLWEIAENFVAGVVGDPPTTEHIADLLAPVLAAMAAHRLVEVRRFAGCRLRGTPAYRCPPTVSRARAARRGFGPATRQYVRYTRCRERPAAHFSAASGLSDLARQVRAADAVDGGADAVDLVLAGPAVDPGRDCC